MNKCMFTKTAEGVKNYIDMIIKNTVANKYICIYKNKSKLIDDELLNIKGIEFVEFASYGKPDSIITDSEENILIVIGLSEMIRPSNRCDIRFEYMYNWERYKNKFVIDVVPFLIEKWRIWYPYGVIKFNAFNYPHSYAMESSIRNYQEYRVDEDPISIDFILSEIMDLTVIDYEKYFDFKIDFVEIKTSIEQKNKYEELKEDLFNKHNTIKPILKGLSDYSSSLFNEYNLIRDLNKFYKIKEDTIFYMTDLKIDQYFKNEILRLYSDTNLITKRCYYEVVL
jgi:hypothetical protein